MVTSSPKKQPRQFQPPTTKHQPPNDPLTENREKKGEIMNNGNLKPFKPGQSGNPGGRPKTAPMQKAIRQALEDPEVAERLVKTLVSNANWGNMRAMKILLDVSSQPDPQSPTFDNHQSAH